MATVHDLRQVPTRVPDEKHLEHLLDQAQGAVNRGDSQLAVTHLGQAVMVAATKGTDLSELEVYRRAKNIIDAGGRVA